MYHKASDVARLILNSDTCPVRLNKLRGTFSTYRNETKAQIQLPNVDDSQGHKVLLESQQYTKTIPQKSSCIMKNLKWIKNSSKNYIQECIFLHDKESKNTQQAKYVDPLQFCLIHQNQSPVQISRIKH